MNENQNPNVNNNVSANGVEANANQVVSNAVEGQVSAPVAPTPQPMPAPATPVQATPMPASPAPVDATPADSPFFTPESVQPETQVSPELPPVAPVQAQEPVQPAAPTASPTQTVETPASPEAPANDVEVIQTAPKGRVSNIILIIFIILLIVFVFNIDTVITMYDQYKNSKNPSNPIHNNTNNLTDGYILINENTSSIKLKNIKFYNFRQSQGKGITFSYEVLSKVGEAKDLDIYIEIYNSEKEILYKELFNPSQKLEKDTVRTYTISVDDDIYSSAFYALVKEYTDKEKNQTSSLTCTFESNNYAHKQTYNFVNNGLSSYDIEKTTKKEEEDTALQNEYESLKDTNNATLEGKTLKYTVDVTKDNGDLVLLYEKDTTLRVIKDRLTAKEWKCE